MRYFLIFTPSPNLFFLTHDKHISQMDLQINVNYHGYTGWVEFESIQCKSINSPLLYFLFYFINVSGKIEILF